MSLYVLAALAILTPQTTAPPPKAPPKTLTLTGCVGSNAGPDRFFTLSDSAERTTYRLSGATVRSYVGQRVQITGGLDSKRLHIVGGLLPSPNVAAQAGAIDPAQAAMAGSGGSAGTGPLPTFKVTRVRPVAGSCPER